MAVSVKLSEFLFKVNKAIAIQKKQGVKPSPLKTREALKMLGGFLVNKFQVPLEIERNYISENTQIRAKIYSPNPQKELNVFFWFHGGGHMCGNVDLYAPIARRLSVSTGTIVVTPDYRKSPENPFPDGLNDSINCIKQAESILKDIPHSSVFYAGGDSAGGAICASLFMRENMFDIQKQVLLYPGLDYSMSGETYKTNGSGYLLETDKIAWYFDQYFQNYEDRVKVSPLFQPIIENMPDTLIITSEMDPLLSEGRAYYEKIKNIVSSEYCEMKGMIHAYLFLEEFLDEEIAQTYDLISKFLN